MATAYCATCRILVVGTRLGGKVHAKCGSRLACLVRCYVCGRRRSPGTLHLAKETLFAAMKPIEVARPADVVICQPGSFVCPIHWLANPNKIWEPAMFTRFEVPGTIECPAQVYDLATMGRQVTGYAGVVR